MPDVELLVRAVDGVVVECGLAEKLPDSAVTGDSGVVSVGFADDDYEALDVGEGALAPSAGIVRGAAGGKAADAQMAPLHLARVGSHRGVEVQRSGEPSPRFAASVVRRPAGQQPDVAWRHARGPQRLDRSAGAVLVGICQCGHEVPVLWDRRMEDGRERLRRACGAVTVVAGVEW